MATRPTIILRHLNRLTAACEAAHRSDRELLGHFVAQGDEASFAALVHRHGPMVLRVCRGVLRDAHAAEDAFQATFLVLIRKAPSLRGRETLGGWLHEAAHRLALRAQSDTQRRLARKDSRPAEPVADPLAEITGRELLAALDEELARLPEAARSPRVLCFLEEKTQDEAALLLGCSLSTLKRRLARGRDLLRARLERRGLTLPAVLAAALVGGSGAQGTASPTLLHATVRAALDFGTRHAVPGNASGSAVSLATGALRAMGHTRAKIIAAILLSLTVLAAGTGLVVRHSPAAPLPEARGPDQPGPEKAPIGPRAEDPGRREELPAGAMLRIGSARLRNAGQVGGLVFAPDGKTLACGGVDGSIRFWDAATGGELRVFRPQNQWIKCLAFSPGGAKLAGGSVTGVISLLDAGSGKELRTLQMPIMIEALAFSPDETLLAAGDMLGTVALFDLTTGKERHRLQAHPSLAWALAFSSDGKLLATGSPESTIRLWDVASGLGCGTITTPPNGATAVRFLPGNTTLVSSGQDGSVRCWDVQTKKEMRRVESSLPGRMCFDLSPDSKTLVSGGGDRALRVWETATGKALRKLPDLPAPAEFLAFSRDGTTLAVVTEQSRIIQLLDVQTGKERFPSAGHRAQVCSVALGADGKTLVTASGDRTARVWDLATGREVQCLPDPANGFLHIAVTGSGKTLAIGGTGAMIRLHDSHTGKKLHEIPAGLGGSHALTFSPDGRTLVAAGSDQVIRLWESATGKERGPFEGRQPSPFALAVSPDGRLLVSGGQEPGVHLWDVVTRKEIRVFATVTMVQSLSFSLDGQLVTVVGQGTLRVFATASGREVKQFAAPKAGIQCVAFAPDGKALASGAADGSVDLWEIGTGKRLGGRKAHRDPVSSLAFSPDGRTLVSGSFDTTVLVWDTAKLLDGSELASPLPVREGQRAAPATRLPEREWETLWSALGGEDGIKAHDAVWALAGAPAQSVPLFKARLRPVPLTAVQLIARHIQDLDNDTFAVRERATEALGQVLEAAAPALRKTLEGQPTPEVRVRIEQLLARHEGNVFSAEHVRAARAIEVLEHIGTAEARAVLAELAKGAPGVWQTEDAKEALGRLARRRGALP